MSYLYKMIIDDIEDKDSIFVVKLPNTTTKKERICTAISEVFGVIVLELYRKYRHFLYNLSG